MNINSPIPAEWVEHVTQTNLGLEVIPAVLYDTATYVDNTTQVLPFFTTQRATQDLSNMNGSGQLANPQSFLMQSLRIFFKVQLDMADSGAVGAFASIANDIILLTNTGILNLQISEKRYGPWPLWMLPAGTFPQVSMSQAGAEAANITANYAQIGGPIIYGLFPHLMLSPMQPFSVTLNWPAGAVNTTGNVVIQVLFDGQLARAIN